MQAASYLYSLAHASYLHSLAVTCTGEQTIRSTVHNVIVVWTLVSMPQPQPQCPMPQYYIVDSKWKGQVSGLNYVHYSA